MEEPLVANSDDDDSIWNTASLHSGLVSLGSDHVLDVQVCGLPRSAVDRPPLILTFHGSGAETTQKFWQPLVDQLQNESRILLYSRCGHGQSVGPIRQTPRAAAEDLSVLLSQLHLSGPFVLIAHSYGGCIVREFLDIRDQDVVGMILVETGQETVSEVGKEQYRKQVLGKRPLCVIRGNSLRGNWISYEEKLSNVQTKEEKISLKNQKALLESWEKEDVRMKREQLRLSKNNKFVQLDGCGHGVIGQRADAVADEVRWVLRNLDSVHDSDVNNNKNNNTTHLQRIESAISDMSTKLSFLRRGKSKG